MLACRCLLYINSLFRIASPTPLSSIWKPHFIVLLQMFPLPTASWKTSDRTGSLNESCTQPVRSDVSILPWEGNSWLMGCYPRVYRPSELCWWGRVPSRFKTLDNPAWQNSSGPQTVRGNTDLVNTLGYPNSSKLWLLFLPNPSKLGVNMDFNTVAYQSPTCLYST